MHYMACLSLEVLSRCRVFSREITNALNETEASHEVLCSGFHVKPALYQQMLQKTKEAAW